MSFKGLSGKKSAFDSLSFSKIADDTKTPTHFHAKRISPLNFGSQFGGQLHGSIGLFSATAANSSHKSLFRKPDSRNRAFTATHATSASAFYATAADSKKSRQRLANVSALTHHSSNYSQQQASRLLNKDGSKCFNLLTAKN